MVLLQTENKELCTTNERQSKRRRLKKTHLQDGGSLSLQEAMVLMTDWVLDNQDYGEMSGHEVVQIWVSCMLGSAATPRSPAIIYEHVN